ncbi:MAG TPA: polysaccharide deacetylase family protein [Candidatus Cybelea sp.]|nr:polysaccharide deacetylase family protein [Candidatus Cybelea sp.]
MSTWTALHAELDAWGAARKTATFWWRDDDATSLTPALEKLLDRAARHRVPLCLAVIPAKADATIPSRLSAASDVAIVQHGFAHANHAPPDAKKAEFLDGRPIADMVSEVADGARRMGELFGQRHTPIFVPPWNRAPASLIARLHGLGFVALSSFGPRRSVLAGPALLQINAHVDPIAWGGGRGFVGEAEALDYLIGLLAARRRRDADPAEPTGLLTHHAAEDDSCANFVERLLDETRNHPAARWLDAVAVYRQALEQMHGLQS